MDGIIYRLFCTRCSTETENERLRRKLERMQKELRSALADNAKLRAENDELLTLVNLK